MKKALDTMTTSGSILEEKFTKLFDRLTKQLQPDFQEAEHMAGNGLAPSFSQKGIPFARPQRIISLWLSWSSKTKTQPPKSDSYIRHPVEAKYRGKLRQKNGKYSVL